MVTSHSRKGHQQLDPLVLVAAAREHAVERFELGVDGLDQPELGVDREPSELVELHRPQELESRLAEQVRRGEDG